MIIIAKIICFCHNYTHSQTHWHHGHFSGQVYKLLVVKIVVEISVHYLHLFISASVTIISPSQHRQLNAATCMFKTMLKEMNVCTLYYVTHRQDVCVRRCQIF